jgi:PAS domain S-box-containing protein
MIQESAHTILLVEDEGIIALGQTKQLEDEGYLVMHALSGEEAIEIVRAHKGKIDLVLMDINLGQGMDGAQAAREILKDHDIRILFLSSHSEREIVEKTEKITSYGYVTKDSGIAVLNASIKMALKLDKVSHELMTQREALRASETKYRNLVETIHDAIFSIDREGVISYVSPAIRKILKYEPGEVIGRNIFEFVHEADLGNLHDRFRDFFEKIGKPFDFRLISASGAVVGITGILSDITERKRADEMLRSAKDYAENLIQTANAIMIGMDTRGNITTFNKAAENITGYTIGDLQGCNWFEVIVPKDRYPHVWAEFEKLSIGGMPKNFENPILTQSGEERYIVWQNSEVLQQGQIVGTISSGIDITERKRADEALRESEKNFSTLAANANMGVLVATSQGNHIYANEHMAQITGYSIPELLKTSMSDLTHPAELSKMAERLEQRFTDQAVPSSFETLIVRKDGAHVPVEVGGAQTVWNGQLADLVIVRDITERKRAEEGLQQSVKQKEILMKELQHRVKNSLALVSGLLGLESDNLSDARAKEIFINTQSRIISMMSVYEQLYSSSDAESIDLRLYIKDLSNLLLKTYVTGKGNILFNTRVDEIKLDTKRALPLGLILNELITNSLKHAYPSGAKGEIHIDLKKTDGRITLGVADDGVGWPKGIDPKTADSMGLNMVKMLAWQLEGEVTIDRKKGTSVLISFKA